jgi:hypothetical protein
VDGSLNLIQNDNEEVMMMMMIRRNSRFTGGRESPGG